MGNFEGYLRRFLRHTEGLAIVTEQYNKIISSEVYERDSKFMPKIGQYSSDLLIEEL
jgi:hypothetical protein